MTPSLQAVKTHSWLVKTKNINAWLPKKTLGSLKNWKQLSPLFEIRQSNFITCRTSQTVQWVLTIIVTRSKYKPQQNCSLKSCPFLPVLKTSLCIINRYGRVCPHGKRTRVQFSGWNYVGFLWCQLCIFNEVAVMPETFLHEFGPYPPQTVCIIYLLTLRKASQKRFHIQENSRPLPPIPKLKIFHHWNYCTGHLNTFCSKWDHSPLATRRFYPFDGFSH